MALESDALPTALRGSAARSDMKTLNTCSQILVNRVGLPNFGRGPEGK